MDKKVLQQNSVKIGNEEYSFDGIVLYHLKKNGHWDEIKNYDEKGNIIGLDNQKGKLIVNFENEMYIVDEMGNFKIKLK